MRQPLVAPQSMNSMKRRTWPESLNRRAIGRIECSFTPRFTTMLIFTGARPAASAASMPASTLATGKSASFMAMKVGSSNASRLTVTRRRPASFSARAFFASKEPLVVSVSSMPSPLGKVMAASISIRRSMFRRSSGSPPVSRNIERLIEMLAAITLPNGEGIELTLTTNGSLLAKKARALKDAGLRRVTVSLDALDDPTFMAMNDADFPVAKVLAGIDAADAAGLAPVKINMVVKRGVNEHSILPMARRFKDSGHVLRFIEFMDVGAPNGWRMDDVIPSREIIRMIGGHLALDPIDPNYPGEVAKRWRYRDGSGEIGVISSVTQAFCRSCTRARISTEGMLYTCLFATSGYDFRALLRGGKSDEEIGVAIAAAWGARDDRYSEIRNEATVRESKIEMSYIGG